MKVPPQELDNTLHAYHRLWGFGGFSETGRGYQMRENAGTSAGTPCLTYQKQSNEDDMSKAFEAMKDTCRIHSTGTSSHSTPTGTSGTGRSRTI